MTNYSEDSGSVRVDYFKPSGKWYMTEAVSMNGFYDGISIHDAVQVALTNHWNRTRGKRDEAGWTRFTVVVLDPYHVNAYPIMLVSAEVNR